MQSLTSSLALAAAIGGAVTPAEATWVGLPDGDYAVTLNCTVSVSLDCSQPLSGTITVQGSGLSAIDFEVGGLHFVGDPGENVITTPNGTSEGSFLSHPVGAAMSLRQVTSGEFLNFPAGTRHWGYCSDMPDTQSCLADTEGTWTARAIHRVDEPSTLAALLLGGLAGLAARGAARRRGGHPAGHRQGGWRALLRGVALALGIGAAAGPASATWMGLSDGDYLVTLQCTFSSVIDCGQAHTGTLTIEGDSATAMAFTINGEAFSGDPTENVADGPLIEQEVTGLQNVPYSFMTLRRITDGDLQNFKAGDLWWVYCHNTGPLNCSPDTQGLWSARRIDDNRVDEPSTLAALLAGLGLMVSATRPRRRAAAPARPTAA